MDYKPYSIEWTRKRYLSEAIQKYFEDGVPAEIVLQDIVDILETSANYHQNQVDKFQNILSNLK
jgi:hypothetical protein